MVFGWIWAFEKGVGGGLRVWTGVGAGTGAPSARPPGAGHGTRLTARHTARHPPTHLRSARSSSAVWPTGSRPAACVSAAWSRRRPCRARRERGRAGWGGAGWAAGLEGGVRCAARPTPTHTPCSRRHPTFPCLAQIEGLQAENRRLLDACSRSDADDVAARADLAHARERWVAATQDNEGLRRELDALRRALEGNVRAMQAVTCGGDGQALTPLVAGSGYAHHASPASASGPETPLGDPLRARGSSPPSAGAPPEAATLYSPFEAYARL